MLKTGFYILVIAMIFCLLYGVLLVFNPEMVAESTLEARTGKTFTMVQEIDVADVITVQTRHLGILSLVATIALIFILFKGFKQGERWAWYAFLITGILVWGYGLIVQIGEGDMLNTILHVIGAALLLFGLVIPFKDFFGKAKAQE